VRPTIEPKVRNIPIDSSRDVDGAPVRNTIDIAARRLRPR
jgi:hypothetical protein